MAQLFSPAANTIARTSILLLGAGAGLAFFVGSQISRSSYNTKAGVPLNQPVPFSHKHHVEELGIDCRYCHPSVEKSGSAGIPPTETCMSCHSQIWTNSPLLKTVRDSYETGVPIQFANGDLGWNKVNSVPQFVYFNHSIHVARGISCNTCHGPVHSMMITYKQQPFSMAWCLECHRNPEKYLYTDENNPDMSPREKVFNLYKKIQANEKLTAREKNLADPELHPYSPSKEELAKGKELVEKYKLKKAQLEDCWVCHR